MKWQIARSGSVTYAFERAAIVTMIMDPEISRVPEADNTICGISFYENRLVIYYQPARKTAGRIGVLINSSRDTIYGILAEEILGETEELEEDFEPMKPGVWVMKCD